MSISRSRFIFLYSLICLIWGSTWLVIHIGSDAALPPFTGAALRFGLAAFIMWIWHYYSNKDLPTTRTEWLAVISIGFLSNGVSFSIVYWCSQYIPSGLMAVIFGTMPLWTAIFSHLALEAEKMSALRIVGIIAGIAGITTIFLPQFSAVTDSNIVPLIALLGAPFVSGIAAVITKRYTHEISPISLNAIATTTGFTLLATLAILSENFFDQSYNLTHVWTIGYLAIFGTIITFVTYFYLIKQVSPVTMSYLTLFTPVIAVFLGWVVLQENLGANEIVGAGLVMAGAKLSMRIK